MEGYVFQDCFVFFSRIFFAFGFLASWLFGFLASWLFGFSASWLLGFSASGLFGFLLVYAAFGGFLALAFWLWLFASPAFPVPLRFGFCGFSLVYAALGGFGFSHPLQFLSGLFGFGTRSLVFRFGFRIVSITSSSLFESSLLRTSCGGSLPPPPTHPLLFRLFAE